MKEILGGCFCGTVRYRIAGLPSSSVLCHCMSCRKLHAAHAVPWIGIDRGQLQIISGKTRRFQSSPSVIRQFCDVCGTPLSYENSQSANTIDIATLSLDEPAAFPPAAEIWLEHKLPWTVLDPSLAHFPKSSLEQQ